MAATPRAEKPGPTSLAPSWSPKTIVAIRSDLWFAAGRPDQGMPAFSLSDADLAAIVAFIHDQKTKAEALGGGRRSVDDADLATGNAAAGRRYFNGAGGCSACHSPKGDLHRIASRYHGLALLQRMLYPDGRPTPAPPDALSAHFDRLGKYTDDDMHNVYAYLVTLK